MPDINPAIFLFIIAALIFIAVWLFIQLAKGGETVIRLQAEKDELQTKNTVLETGQLKFQLQPHTLRNIIAQIHIASKNLYRGTESLADLLDYVLYHDDQHLVSVKDEIDFLESYKILQSRFVYQADSMEIDIQNVDDTSDYYQQQCIPHLITGYFIENAFKHGDIHAPEFIKVSVALTEKQFRFHVQNRFVDRPLNGRSGIGLANMRKRLELLHPGRFEIDQKAEDNQYHSTLIINF